jgi:hypothetical protein
LCKQRKPSIPKDIEGLVYEITLGISQKGISSSKLSKLPFAAGAADLAAGALRDGAGEDD